MEKLKKLPITTRSAIFYICLLAGIFIGAVSSQFDFGIGMMLGFVLLVAGAVWHIVFCGVPIAATTSITVSPFPNSAPIVGKSWNEPAALANPSM